MSGSDADSIFDHFYEFSHSAGGLHVWRSFLQLVWLLCAWTIWNDRNNRLFNNVENFIVQLLDKVKHTSLRWLHASNVNFVYGFIVRGGQAPCFVWALAKCYCTCDRL